MFVVRYNEAFFPSFQQISAAQASSGLSDAEKREKRAMEQKMLEMEEELKVREKMRNLLPYPQLNMIKPCS